jgi:Transposase DDE domain.
MTSYSIILKRDRAQAYLYLKDWTTKLLNPNTNKDTLKVLLLAAIDNDYVEGCAQSLHVCGQTVRNHLKEQNPQHLLQVNQQIIQEMTHRGALTKPLIIAIDWHDEMYYGDPKAEGIVGAQPKNGSCRAYRYGTISVLLNGERLTLAATPIRDRCRLAHVKRLLDYIFELGLKVELLLLDRGYFSTALIKYLNDASIKFIMHIPWHKKPLKPGTDMPYTTTSHKKRKIEQASFRVVVVRQRGKAIVLATNTALKLGVMGKTYRKRWGVETSYRMIGLFLAKTTSKLYRLRVLYFFLAVVLYNLWVLRNFRRSRRVSVGCLSRRVLFCLVLGWLPDLGSGG